MSPITRHAYRKMLAKVERTTNPSTPVVLAVDQDGTRLMITPSATGDGLFYQWFPSEEPTPASKASPSIPQTPQRHGVFDAGSVLQTPGKRRRPLRSADCGQVVFIPECETGSLDAASQSIGAADKDFNLKMGREITKARENQERRGEMDTDQPAQLPFALRRPDGMRLARSGSMTITEDGVVTVLEEEGVEEEDEYDMDAEADEPFAVGHPGPTGPTAELLGVDGRPLIDNHGLVVFDKTVALPDRHLDVVEEEHVQVAVEEDEEAVAISASERRARRVFDRHSKHARFIEHNAKLRGIPMPRARIPHRRDPGKSTTPVKARLGPHGTHLDLMGSHGSGLSDNAASTSSLQLAVDGLEASYVPTEDTRPDAYLTSFELASRRLERQHKADDAAGRVRKPLGYTKTEKCLFN